MRRRRGPDRGEEADGKLIRRARIYELHAGLGFLGRRRRVYDDLVARSGARPGDRVLDIGCGTGYLTRRAARAVGPDGHVTGIDPSRSVLDYARRRAPANSSFDTAGAQQLPFPDAAFDVVLSSLAVHHVPPDEQPTALGEAYRVLKPGGRLLIADFRPRRGGATGHLRHAAGHTANGHLADLVARAGFETTGIGEGGHRLLVVQALRPAARS